MSVKEQISQWVDEHSDYLFRYALRHFGDRTVAEDLVQETLLAAMNAQTAGKDAFRGDAAVRTWLTGILRHKIIDRIRQKTRQKTTSLDEVFDGGQQNYFDAHDEWNAADGPVPWSSNPDTLFEQKQFLTVLESCLEGLSPRLREIFLLREWDELSREEICSALDLTSTNVGVMLHRGRLGLRDCLQHKWLSAAEESDS